MADSFDQFLASSLAPPGRLPDRAFVSAVQLRMQMEDRLERQRRQMLASVGTQLAALVAVAAGLWLLTQAAPVAGFLREEPGLAFALLVAAFGLLVALVTRRPSGTIRIDPIF